MKCDAVTSAVNTPEELSATTPQLFKDIDRVSLNTLKECMQTVYEDGPKETSAYGWETCIWKHWQTIILSNSTT